MAVATLRVPIGAIVMATLSWRHYEALPALAPAFEPPGVWPRISVIVPARDEEHRLPALLRSLQALRYPDYEVIVVDDDSHDATAEVALAHAARLVRGAPLPAGWTGKAYACNQGAAAADGQWLLFTDADTVHEPESLAMAVAYALRHGLGALSLMTGQRCLTFFERLLLPLAYAGLFAGLAPGRINGASGAPSPLANGQYVLVRRDVYERAGGHGTVRASIIEDAALARRLLDVGASYRLCRAESLVRVRMYAGLGDLWAGFRKNAARYVADDKRRLPGTALHTVALVSTASHVLTALRLADARMLAHALPGYGATALGLVPWYRRFGVPARYALLYPLGVTLFGLITLDSAYRTTTRRGSAWKGRLYR